MVRRAARAAAMDLEKVEYAVDWAEVVEVTVAVVTSQREAWEVAGADCWEGGLAVVAAAMVVGLVAETALAMVVMVMALQAESWVGVSAVAMGAAGRVVAMAVVAMAPQKTQQRLSE